MKKITLNVMEVEEAFMLFKGNPHLRDEYKPWDGTTFK